ncbi:MAG: hypothetical protein LBQ44_10320 [Treponema sp.]|jgi:hypothetical protein|nr:hypothetical protein [Treponema sp.]
MNRVKLFLAGVLFVFGVLPLAAQYSKTDLQNMYMRYLRAEGYSPEIDKDGDVSFKFEGKYYYIEIYEDDLEFFRVVFPNFWEIESGEERAQVAQAASWANRRTKAAKVYMTDKNTTIAVELFIPKPEDFTAVFSRSLQVISTALGHFRDGMAEQKQP